MGFDARYRLGNLSIEPTYIHLLGTRKFCSPGSRIGDVTVGTPPGTACTSVRADEIDFNAFEARLKLLYTLGRWNLGFQAAWISGNEATDDINNQGLPGTRRAQVERFTTLSTTAIHRFGEWLEVLGMQESSVLGDLLNGSPGDFGGLDRFGLRTLVFRPEYKATDRLVLEGAVGAYWTEEPTACPASLRRASTTDPRGFTCGGPLTGASLTPSAQRSPAFDFTGNSRFLGWEVDVGHRFTIMPGLTWQTRFGWAFLGDAFEIRNGNVQDAWIISNRILYAF